MFPRSPAARLLLSQPVPSLPRADIYSCCWNSCLAQSSSFSRSVWIQTVSFAVSAAPSYLNDPCKFTQQCFLLYFTGKRQKHWGTSAPLPTLEYFAFPGHYLSTEPFQLIQWSDHPAHPFSASRWEVWGQKPYLKAHPSLSPHSDKQTFHYRKQPGCLLLITSLSWWSLEMGSRRGSCTTIFARAEVSQHLIVFQILFSAILEHECIVCFFHSSWFFTGNTQQLWNHSSQEHNYSSQLFQHFQVSPRNMTMSRWSSF